MSRNPDAFMITSVLDAIQVAQGAKAQSKIQGAAGVGWEQYLECRDMLLASGDIRMERHSELGEVPRINPQGIEKLRDLKRHLARFSIENEDMKKIRQKYAAVRDDRKKRRAARTTHPGEDARADSA